MLAKGITFSVGDGGGPEVFSAVPRLVDIKASDSTKWATAKTTAHDSTTPVETIAPTIRTDQPITLDIQSYDKTDPVHGALRTLAFSGAANNFRVTYPGGLRGSFDFAGYVTGWDANEPVDGLESVMVTITPNGPVNDDQAKITTFAVSDTFHPTYVTGNQIKFAVTFDELVDITGTPRVTVVLGSGTVHVPYASGTGTHQLNFSYTVGGGDAATATHFTVSSPLDLNGGTIKDKAKQAAVLTFTPATTTAYTVN